MPIKCHFDGKLKPIFYEIEVEMAMTPNGKYLYIGGYSLLKKFDSMSLRLIEQIKTNDLYINGLAMSPDSSCLYIGSLFREMMKLNFYDDKIKSLKGCK